MNSTINPEIILVWPKGQKKLKILAVGGYHLIYFEKENDSLWIDIHNKAVPSFNNSDLKKWYRRYSDLALEKGIIAAIDNKTGEPASTAGSLSNSKNGMFPNGGQLGWVATVPEHRKRGLAQWLCALATNRLLTDRYQNIFLCTGIDMLPAVSVYLRLGYVPCLYNENQRDLWRFIGKELNDHTIINNWIGLKDYLMG